MEVDSDGGHFRSDRRLRTLSLMFALVLLVANGLAWAGAFEPVGPTYPVEPVLESGLAELRDKLRAGGHGGERFELHITDQEAANSIAWFLSNHPEIPFREPRIAFHPNEVEAWGVTTVLGLRLSIHGRATMTLEHGIPIVRLTDLGVAGAPVPSFILETIQDEFYRQVDLSDRQMPIVFETMELREGEAIATGTILPSP
ncbi:MAG: hypothetical protein N2508_04855 [Anaerolineae bacterium]|nr:hypothetical protein [Anaerolineae bacterium]